MRISRRRNFNDVTVGKLVFAKLVSGGIYANAVIKAMTRSNTFTVDKYTQSTVRLSKSLARLHGFDLIIKKAPDGGAIAAQIKFNNEKEHLAFVLKWMWLNLELIRSSI